MCMYVCMLACLRARASAVLLYVHSVCGWVWGVCAVHVLIRALDLECIWFMLGHGACASVVFVCACLQVLFLSDYSVIMWVWSGCGCV